MVPILANGGNGGKVVSFPYPALSKSGKETRGKDGDVLRAEYICIIEVL